MSDEFRVLRPVILITSGLLVLGIVLHACREAEQQRARISGRPPSGMSAANATSCHAMQSPAVFRVFPPASPPGGNDGVLAPAID